MTVTFEIGMFLFILLLVFVLGMALMAWLKKDRCPICGGSHPGYPCPALLYNVDGAITHRVPVDRRVTINQ